MYVPRFYYKIYYTVNWPNCRLIFLFALNQSIAGFQLGWPLNGLHPPHAKICEEKNVFAGELQVSLASFVQNYGFLNQLTVQHVLRIPVRREGSSESMQVVVSALVGTLLERSFFFVVALSQC